MMLSPVSRFHLAALSPLLALKKQAAMSPTSLRKTSVNHLRELRGRSFPSQAISYLHYSLVSHSGEDLVKSSLDS